MSDDIINVTHTSITLKGVYAEVYSGQHVVAELTNWQMDYLGNGRSSFSAESMKPDLTRWQFRDRSQDLVVDLVIRRQHRRYRVMLSSETPFAGEATLDANKAEDGFW